ncbi:hypothetical protein HZQ57_14015 [Elizabethkingia anophelis]|uniref:HNH endonuclease n=1 Tax=Elizabethkingia miricola TaxID=172045 RepID=A0ABD5B1U5_ELIMR|nr:hypothetical protein [Elizabethkingia miricola]MCT3806328.1 hypothetical protein [Elizabethkingia anophelis]MCT3813514.1 hypothetical protein [Elizabethkingia anophelis]MCT3820609.1 hypothetical protein [Elizabethkingia anophelis]MDQ8747818.1 hypothetical protein [Elizabethkingia miricola]
MSRKIKNKKLGICRLCLKEDLLSFEHFPPKSTFNKKMRYVHLDPEEMYKLDWLRDEKSQKRIYEGPLGDHSLCEDCNNFLNREYVGAFRKFAYSASHILSSIKPESDTVYFRIEELNLLRIYKHIISMFISMNDIWYSKDSYSELREFINNPNRNYLPDKYRLYLYLVRPHSFRKLKWSFVNNMGAISEFAFYPFGFVFSYDNLILNSHSPLYDLFPWKFFNSERESTVDFILPIFETHLPIPMDYRQKDALKSYL